MADHCDSFDDLYDLILFENLFKPRQLYLQPQNSVLSSLQLAS
ncbi:DNA alkylation repair protein [Streptococcus pneumoniae]|nr:DNA alkylation repair protein [Streptococcus pneumoniae]